MSTETNKSWNGIWMYLLFEPLFFLCLLIAGKRTSFSDSLSLMYVIWLIIGYVILPPVLSFLLKHIGKTYPVLKTPYYLEIRAQLATSKLTSLVCIVGLLAFHRYCKQTGIPFWNIHIFSNPNAIYSWTFTLIPTFVLFLCLHYIFFSYIEYTGNIKSIKKLSKLNKEQLDDKKYCLYILYNDAGSVINERYLFKHDFFEKHYCLQTPDAYRQLYKEQTEQIIERSPVWCYLIRERSTDSLKQKLNEIKTHYLSVSTAKAERSVIVINSLPGPNQTVSFPAEYRNNPWLIYDEIDDIDKFTIDYILEKCPRENDAFQQSNPFSNHQSAFYFFENIKEFRETIFEQSDINTQAVYRCSHLEHFYINANHFRSPARSVLALLDYAEMLLRLVSIYIYQKTDHDATALYTEEDLLEGKFFPMADYIWKNKTILPQELQEHIKEVKSVPVLYMPDFIRFLSKKMNISFTGDTISFLGLVSLIQAIRNRIVAHGVLNRENAAYAWVVLYWGTLLLNHYLVATDFVIDIQGQDCSIGYQDDLVNVGKYIYIHNNYPCLALQQKQNKKLLYVNYFDGVQITPEIFTK